MRIRIHYCLALFFITIFGFCNQSHNPKVLMETKYGNIVLAIFADKAPVSSANFLRYLDEDRFSDAHFYRVVAMENQPKKDIKIEVIQGGLGWSPHELRLPEITHETTDETGILHKDGVISMARNEPGTASSEFFICVGDQPSLDFGGMRNPDGQGFAAFGKVIKGMAVVRKIQNMPEKEQLLVEKVKILRVSRME